MQSWCSVGGVVGTGALLVPSNNAAAAATAAAIAPGSNVASSSTTVSSALASASSFEAASCAEILVANIPAKKLNIVPHKTLNFDLINFAI